MGIRPGRKSAKHLTSIAPLFIASTHVAGTVEEVAPGVAEGTSVLAQAGRGSLGRQYEGVAQA